MPLHHRPERSYYVYLIVLGLAIVFGISLSPSPITGFLIHPGDSVPTGFAPPYNILRNNDVVLMVDPADITGDQEQVTLTVTAENDAVYKYFYLWINGEWERFQFDEVTSDVNSAWIFEQADASLTIDKSRLAPGRNFVVTYSCSNLDESWQCGCASANRCGFWQLQTFQVGTSEPPTVTPTPPNAPACTDECASGQTRCSADGVAVQSCSNYDPDACLEYPSTTTGAGSQTCANGCLNAACRPAPVTAGVPRVLSVFPAAYAAGQTVSVALNGENLEGAQLSFPGTSGITVAGTQSAASIATATFTIAATATPGAKTLTIKTVRGETTATFTVNPALAVTVQQPAPPTSATGTVRATLTANGAERVANIYPGESVAYEWSSLNANNGRATATFAIDQPDTCPNTNGGKGPFPFLINGVPLTSLRGTGSGVVQACQAGRTYTINYTVIPPTGPQVSDTVTITVASGPKTADSPRSAESAVAYTSECASSSFSNRNALFSSNPTTTATNGETWTNNPLHFATASTAQQLASCLGASVTQTDYYTGPVHLSESMQEIRFDNGVTLNAGLTAELYNKHPKHVADSMVAAMVRLGP